MLNLLAVKHVSALFKIEVVFFSSLAIFNGCIHISKHSVIQMLPHKNQKSVFWSDHLRLSTLFLFLWCGCYSNVIGNRLSHLKEQLGCNFVFSFIFMFLCGTVVSWESASSKSGIFQHCLCVILGYPLKLATISPVQSQRCVRLHFCPCLHLAWNLSLLPCIGP